MCGCSDAPTGNAIKINPGYCIISMTGEIKSGESSRTIIPGHIVSVSNKIFDVKKDCHTEIKSVVLEYNDSTSIGEITAIFIVELSSADTSVLMNALSQRGVFAKQEC